MDGLYESRAMRAITGPSIRPGDVELTGRALALCALPAGARVLDVGCGMGTTVAFLRRHHHLEAFGVDPSPVLLEEGLGRDPALGLFQAAAEALPFPNRCFDALFCECVLSLLDDPLKALREFARVLAPGGTLILSDVYARLPDGVPSLRKLPVRCCIRGAMGRRRILALIAESGLVPTFWEDHSNLLKRLVAQLVLDFDSLDAFWTTTCGLENPQAIQASILRGRPGYYLLTAAKKGETHA